MTFSGMNYLAVVLAAAAAFVWGAAYYMTLSKQWLAASAEKANEICMFAKQAGIPATRLGETGGDSLRLGAAKPILVRELLDAHESWMPTYMAGGGKSA